MIRYVPSSSAEPLSLALWGLARPPDLQDDLDSKYLFGWVDDRNTPPKRWLVVDTTATIWVHPQASYERIRPLVQRWIEAGLLPPTTHTDLETLIAAHLGGQMVVWDAFPQAFKDSSITEQQMEDAEWMPSTNALFAAPKR